VAQAQAAGGIGGQGAQAIPGLRFGPRAPAPASPQQAIDHRSQPAHAALLGQLHAGAHRRRGRHPGAEKQLVEPQVQQPAQLGGLASGGHLAKGIKPAVEQAPLADGAVGQLGGQGAVGAFEGMALQLTLQGEVGVGPRPHCQQHLPGQLARRQTHRGSLRIGLWGGNRLQGGGVGGHGSTPSAAASGDGLGAGNRQHPPGCPRRAAARPGSSRCPRGWG
jgi:hypothetical protein